MQVLQPSLQFVHFLFSEFGAGFLFRGSRIIFMLLSVAYVLEHVSFGAIL
jgi:hypothetical protein